MVLFVEIISGPQQGSRFKIEHGHKIGRNRGEIPVDDNKISGQHAQFEVDNKGQFVLIDLDSSNGLLLANRRVKRIAMMPGVVFRVGRTDFRVLTVETPAEKDFARVRTWRENLVGKLSLEQVENQLSAAKGKPFSPTLELKFVQGVQADESLLLGYGPRTAGSCSLDIDLRDPEAPDSAFQIIPGNGLAQIKNLCKNKLSLNNKAVDTETLQDGDLIRVGGTLIKVTYI